jgi:hypothetical protein
MYNEKEINVHEEPRSKEHKKKNEAPVSTNSSARSLNWTDNEKEALLKALKIYNWRDYNLMADIVKTRTASQVESYLYNILRGRTPNKSELYLLALEVSSYHYIIISLYHYIIVSSFTYHIEEESLLKRYRKQS